MSDTYKVVRFFRRSHCRHTIKRGLTLEQAQGHCRDTETSSSTCRGHRAKRRTWRAGEWFDGYTKE